MLTLIVLVLVNLIVPGQSKYLTLNGNDWTLHDSTNQYFISNVTVPGGLFTDLWAANLTDDPLAEKNDLRYRHFTKLNWTWAKRFNVDESDLESPLNEVYILINGIDTISRISINGYLVGETDNMFIRYRFKINDYLQEKDNLIEIEIRSPVLYASERAAIYKERFNYTIVPECWPEVYNGECHVNFIRKMAASFSWDWGPAFPSSGIWLPIAIEIIQRENHLDNFWVSLGESDCIEGNKSWTLDISLKLINPVDQSQVYAQVTLSTDQDIDSRFERKLIVYRGQIVTSSTIDQYSLPRIAIDQSRVALWWPNGMSTYSNGTTRERKRILYNCTVTLRSAFNLALERQELIKRIGFRSVKLIQESPKAGTTRLIDGSSKESILPGLSFRFEINGVPLYIKGTNVIPTSVFPELESRQVDYVKRLLKTVTFSSMNMIRIWGGGIYQTDRFYDLADEMGILVWQDFMFACMTYPVDQFFLDNVRDEVIAQVTRLSHHPSIALWSGNNEDETAIATGWWPELQTNITRYIGDYLKLNRDTIKATVKQFDGSRIFVSSSPSNGDETEAQGGLSMDPGDYLFGDVHFYSYDSDPWNQSKYPEARFISEYGFESYSSLQSFASVIPTEKLLYPLTDLLEHRQHHPNGTTEMETMIDTYFGLPPSSGTTETLAKMIYLSQCLQAMAVKLETEVYLRNRKVDQFTGTKLTWGAMYWMLNDIWVSTSWSSLEFNGKWKMLQYYIKEVFNSVHGQVFRRKDHNDEDTEWIEVMVNNDFTGDVKLRVDLNVYTFDSFTPKSVITDTFVVKSYQADSIWSLNLKQTIRDSGACLTYNNCLIHLKYQTVPSFDSDLNQGQNFLLLAKPKELALRASLVRIIDVHEVVSIDPRNQFFDDPKVFRIRLSADYPALFVWLDFKLGSFIDGVFSSNGFIMVHPIREIYFQTNDPNITLTSVRDSLTVTHLSENR